MSLLTKVSKKVSERVMAWRLVPVAAVVAALLPGVGYSLGLGNISVRSGLNQPMRAEIDVLAEDARDLAGFNARLAEAADFQRAGLERPAILSRLRFEITHRPNGKAVITVRSTESMREPFLNFLLEVNWPSGRLLREYAVLLDPPRQILRTASLQPFAAEREDRRSTARSLQGVEPSEGGAGTTSRTPSDHYGPVRRDETLWKIAGNIRPDPSLSNQQIMTALLKANPENFEDNNLNGLKAGSILKVPSLEQMRAMSREEAMAELHHHRQTWQGRHNRSTAAPLATTATATTPSKSARDVRPEPGAVSLSSGGTTAELRLLSPTQKDREPGQTDRPTTRKEASKVSGGDAGLVTALRQQIDLVQEVSHTNQKESEEMRLRLAELEKQIGAMQRMLRIKDENLAALQAQLRGEASGTSPAATQSPSPVETLPTTSSDSNVQPLASVASAAPLNRPDATSPVVSEPSAVVQPTTVQPTPTAQPAVSAESSVTLPIVPMSEQAPDTASTAAVSPASPPTSTPVQPNLATIESPESILDLFLADQTLVGLVVALLGTVGLLVGLLIHRRRATVVTKAPPIVFPSDINVEVVPLQAKVEKTPPASGLSLGKSGEITIPPKSQDAGSNQFQGNLSTWNKEANQASDPLFAEVESCVLRGRHQQAVDLIQPILARDPDRADLRLKMLELHFATKDRPAFIEQAQQLRGVLGARNDHFLWQKALAMGRELAPGHALFAGAPLATPAGVPLGAVANNIFGLQVSSLPADFSATQVVFPSVADAELGEPGQTIEFDLGFLDSLDGLDDMDDPSFQAAPEPPPPLTFAPTSKAAQSPVRQPVAPLVVASPPKPPVAIPVPSAATHLEVDSSLDDMFTLDIESESTISPASSFTTTTLISASADGLEDALPWDVPKTSVPGPKSSDSASSMSAESSNRRSFQPVEAAAPDLSWDMLKTSTVSIDLNESMEFDLIGMDDLAESPDSTEPSKSSAVILTPPLDEDSFLSMDFLSLGEEEATTVVLPSKKTSPETTPVSEDLDNSFTFDLIDMEQSTFTEEKGPQPTSLADASENWLGGRAETKEEFDDFGDAIQNNLEMAQAYLDIGDKEGAREALQEVIEEGNPAQRKMAEVLLARIK
ncbi:pilus assembly protein FimV [Gammaproteobacteria bacterium]